jgi:hypothetical protein
MRGECSRWILIESDIKMADIVQQTIIIDKAVLVIDINNSSKPPNLIKL